MLLLADAKDASVFGVEAPVAVEEYGVLAKISTGSFATVVAVAAAAAEAFTAEVFVVERETVLVAEVLVAEAVFGVALVPTLVLAVEEVFLPAAELDPRVVPALFVVPLAEAVFVPAVLDAAVLVSAAERVPVVERVPVADLVVFLAPDFVVPAPLSLFEF